jgi:hypothetical protein
LFWEASVIDVVVVYESVFGNTRLIAEAVAAGMRAGDPDARVEVLAVAEAAPDKIGEAALVVVGAPTHLLGMSRPFSRRKAGEAAAAGSGNRIGVEPGGAGPRVREWLDALPRPLPGRMAAAFDTRLAFPLTGGAARAIARGLHRRGYDVVASPAGFIVDGTEGPLHAGEPDRASEWGVGLVQRLAGQAVR